MRKDRALRAFLIHLSIFVVREGFSSISSSIFRLPGRHRDNLAIHLPALALQFGLRRHAVRRRRLALLLSRL